MSISLDCRDGKHRACAACGGCCCECHEILHLTGEPALTDEERVQLEHDWALLVWEWPELPQPRGSKRLMSGVPAAWLRWAAIVVVGIGSGAAVPLLAIGLVR